ncbi:MAG: glycosyltransferase [Granulosicoccus sp.]|nr:glycosyltransferase [Granulosicoccus sp.]
MKLTVDTTSKPIRLLVMSDAVPERNGVGSYYADLTQHLLADVEVETAELIYPMCDRMAAHSYLTAPLPGDKTQPIQLPKPGHLISEFKSINPNVIVVPTPGPYGMAGLYLARRYKIPLIAGFHTHYEALTELYWNRFTGSLTRRFLAGCNRLIFRYSHSVLANSPDMCRQAQNIGAKNIALMGTSVAPEFLTTPMTPANQEIKSILFAGRLAKEKNIEAVIDAAKNHRDIQFTIAGDGPLHNEIRKAADFIPNIAMTGWVSRDRLLDLIDSHDALLLPSHIESFGTVALEGMARGRIVIVSQRCGLTEWADLNDAVIQIGADETATETIQRIQAASPQWKIDIGTRAAAAARDINGWNTQFWINLLTECTSENSDSDTNISAPVVDTEAA